MVPVIQTLPSHVVERIAAGEVIQDAISAIKELLENSLDAGANLVVLDLYPNGDFRIRDNGHGIRFEDLSILCRPHTTSKLFSFEELKTIQTLGFRGEALCSTSYVARLTITTRPENSPYGMCAEYKDGNLISDPKPCPLLPGTTISVRDLFADQLVRRQAHKSEDIWPKCMEWMRCFALHCTETGFVVRCDTKRQMEIRISAEDTQLDRLAKLFGCEMAGNAIPLDETVAFKSERMSRWFQFRLTGWMNAAENLSRRSTFVLFINNRYVRCSAIKRAVEGVYSIIFPKGYSFVYFSLQLPETLVDVNVHPAKREVEFSSKETILQCLVNTIRQKLLTSQTARTLKMPSKDLGVVFEDKPKIEDFELHSVGDERRSALPLRVGGKNWTMHSEDVPWEDGKLILQEHSLVGITLNRYACVQFQTGLYLLDMQILSKHFACQQISQNVGKLKKHHFDSPIPLKTLLTPSFHDKDVMNVEYETKTSTLLKKKTKLDEFFSIEISQHGDLIALPKLTDTLLPNMKHLSSVLNSLAQFDFVSQQMESTELISTLFALDASIASEEEMHSKRIRNLLNLLKDDFIPSMAHKSAMVQLTTIDELCRKFQR